MGSLLSVADLSRRDRVLISTCILVVTALAWAYLVHLDRQMSASMAHDTMMAEMGMTMDVPWTAADIFFTFAMWTVMMVGMMAGTAAPVLLLFAAAHGKRDARGMPLAVLLFALGYLVVWVGFSACAAAAQWALHQAAMLSPAMSQADHKDPHRSRLRAQGHEPTGRLIDTGGLAKTDRIIHRIPITSIAEIDDEVKRWLRKAYEMDA